MTHTIHQAIDLAKVFGAHMQEELSTNQFRAAVYANRCEPNSKLICHTHDY